MPGYAPIVTPECIRAATENYQWTPASDGESGAKVYRLDRTSRPTLYLKFGAGKIADDITAEMVRLRWLARFGLVPQVYGFHCYAGQAWLLTTAVRGQSAYDCLISDQSGRPAIVEKLAKLLLRMHSLPLRDCPFKSDYELRMADARRNLESGQVDELDFNSDHQGCTAEQIWMEMQSLLPLPFDSVVTHGDFSLDNIFLEERKRNRYYRRGSGWGSGSVSGSGDPLAQP